MGIYCVWNLIPIHCICLEASGGTMMTVKKVSTLEFNLPFALFHIL